MFVTVSGRWLAMLFISLLWAAASCGGGTTGLAPGGPQADSRILPLGSGLPALPDDVRGRETPNNGGSRGTSALNPYNGADFIAAAGATVEGTSVILESAPGEMAWALYKAEGLQGMDVTQFAIETVPTPGDQYSVGISNFTDDRWEYFITSDLPEVDVDLTEETQRLISILGNLYWIVIVADGASVQVDTAWLDIVEGNDDAPAIPQGLWASVDQPDNVMLWWLPSDGATSYGLYRKAANTDGLFEHIADVTDPYYCDYDAAPLGEYEYKVNASNAHGTSDFSEVTYGAVGKEQQYEFAFGPIESITDNAITVEGKTFTYDDFTYWFNEWGLPVDWTDFTVGEEVYVDGFIDENGNLVAYYVASADDWYDRYWHWASGAIEAIDATSVTIAGDTFLFTAFTYITDEFGNPVSWDFFQVGDQAYVSGYYDESGVLYADCLQPFEDNWANFVEGYVDSIDATSITLSGVTVPHSPTTVWYDELGNIVTWEEFEVGHYCYLEFETLADGSIHALYVVRYHKGQMYYNGYITALGEGTFTLDNEWHYTFDEASDWYFADGTPATVADFAVGEYVTVESQRDDDDSGGYALNVYKTDGDWR